MVLLFGCGSFTACFKPPAAESVFDYLVFSNFSSAVNVPIAVQVQVTGMTGGTLVVSDGQSPNLTFTADGTQSFGTKLPSFSTYNVSIVSQPVVTPARTCQITNPSGTVLGPATIVQIQCALAFYSVSVQVSGVYSGAPAGLILENNGADRQTINSGNGTYSFPTTIGDQLAYNVTVVQNPVGHTCVFKTTPANSGTMNGAAITLRLNCLSSILVTPGSVLQNSDKIVFRISDPNVSGCTVVAGSPGGATYNINGIAGFTMAFQNNLAGTTDFVIGPPGISPGDWGMVSPATAYVAVSGCQDSAGNIINEGVTPISAVFNVIPAIRYVNASGGSDSNTCQTPGAPCLTIGSGGGITKCGLGFCYILVAGGTYNVTTPITISGKISIVGAYNNTFTSQDPIGNPTIISDVNPACGTSYPGAVCSAIRITNSTLAVNEWIELRKLRIEANRTGQIVTGVYIDSAAPLGQFYLRENLITGMTKSTAFANGDERYGIIVRASQNVNILFNIISGGAGGGISAGVLADAVSAETAIHSNLIDGGFSNNGSGLYAAAIDVRNPIANNNFLIGKNQINPFQYNGGTPPALRSNITFGVKISGVGSSNALFIVANSIFTGDGITGSTAVAYQNPGPTLQVNNNLLFGYGATGSSIALDVTNSPVGSHFSWANDYFAGTLLRMSFTIPSTVAYCDTPNADFSTTLVAPCSIITPPLGNFGTLVSYNRQVQFQTPGTLNDIKYFLPKTSLPFPPCQVVFGGLMPPLPGNFTNIMNSDFLGVARTGANGFTVGAFELDPSASSCAP
ncbi:hypothetical protein CH373_05615 [Leptospira perolatii]|uniref:Uncharacterized protein n=1 Tax=Leptospira perolatii TaxID=2023191 RepID=A0A2M9ZQM2_9LEPT|nr:hypothetical protein [Leptospira perolatii]PJZ70544.1 hypothetical protein CH360_06035 [Leptospira perolatii]PJZ74380.1 hypothetical protein CH373_05615 [Leptospira perolatii]